MDLSPRGISFTGNQSCLQWSTFRAVRWWWWFLSFTVPDFWALQSLTPSLPTLAYPALKLFIALAQMFADHHQRNWCPPPFVPWPSFPLCFQSTSFFFTFFFLSAGWLADIFSHQNQMPWGQIQHFIFYLQSFVEGLQYSKCSTNNCWITTPVNRETC